MATNPDVFGEPFGDTVHAYPDVFNTVPVQPKERKPGQLTDNQIKQFFDQGYIIVEDYVDTSLLDSVKDDLGKIVDCFANVLYKAGKLKSLHSEYGFYQRLAKMEEEYPGSAMLMHKAGFLSDSVKKLWTDEKLLNCMEQFLGTRDIQGHPVWNIRTKVPNNEATVVPWHQDVGYTDNESHQVLTMTAWIPLLDTNAKNGCMEVIKNGQKTGRVVPHYSCWKSTHYVEIMEKEMEEVLGVNVKRDNVVCEVPYGGVLFLSNILPHRSLPNLSNAIRWSLDLRWQRCDQSVGWYGMGKGIQFSSSTDPSFKPDWKSFVGEASLEAVVNNATKDGTVFDVLNPGPWIQKWKITNKNQHVGALEKGLQDANSTKELLTYHALPQTVKN